MAHKADEIPGAANLVVRISKLERTTRLALFGVAGMFFSHGAMVAIRAAYVPVIKTQLNASESELALCLTAMGLGFLLAIALSNMLVRRFGSARVTLYSVIAAAFLFAAQAYITGLWAMVISLFLLGAVVGMSDIAMNVQASVVEQRAGASYMTRIHGFWSVGAIMGSIVAGAVIEHVPAAVFTVGFSVLSVLAAYVSILAFVAEDRGKLAGKPMFELPPTALWPVCLMAFLALLVVGGIRDWVPIFLLENVGSTLGLSVQTFAAFQATTAIGRFSGDFIRERFGDKPLLLAGGLLGCVAMFAGLASRSATGMFVALAVLGLAHANIIPALISIGGKQDPGNESRNVSSVMGLGYGGFMLGPILIGALAQAKGLTIGLATVGAASLLISLIVLFPGRPKNR